MSTNNEVQILLVDDNHLLREGIQLWLEAMGHTVYSADCGQQALTMFQSHPIDLAVLDIQMPEMDGYTLCAELRKQRTVPVIFISASQRLNERQQAMSVGAVDFLSKPFLLPDIGHSIQRALQTAA